MKIIIKGDRQRAMLKRLKIRRFTCRLCGCVFEADRNEYKEDQVGGVNGLYCKCPCCDEYVMYNGAKNNMDETEEKYA